MSYRPICDMWLLARPKVSYYGESENRELKLVKKFLLLNQIKSVLSLKDMLLTELIDYV